MKAIEGIKFEYEDSPSLYAPTLAMYSDVVDIQDFHIEAIYEASVLAREIWFGE